MRRRQLLRVSWGRSPARGSGGGLCITMFNYTTSGRPKRQSTVTLGVQERSDGQAIMSASALRILWKIWSRARRHPWLVSKSASSSRSHMMGFMSRDAFETWGTSVCTRHWSESESTLDVARSSPVPSISTNRCEVYCSDSDYGGLSCVS